MPREECWTRWGLSDDYLMVAPAHAEKRRELANKNGLGRKPCTKVAPKPRRAKKST